MLPLRFSISFVLLTACSGSAATIEDSSSAPSGTTTTSTTSEGPHVILRLGGSVDPVAHADGFAGETAKVQIAAIKSLWLLRSDDDPNPVKVFELDEPIEVDYVAGKPITLASVSRATIPSGTYRKAKVGVSYVKYSVAARMHSAAIPVDGQYDNVQVLSDGAKIDGVVRARGWYRYSFSYLGTTYGSLEGNDAPTPAVPKGGGVELDTSGADAFYTFGFDAAYDAAVTYDETVTFTANVHEGFRWQDQPTTGYAAGVFDTTASTFEPVMSFGANAYAVSFERATN